MTSSFWKLAVESGLTYATQLPSGDHCTCVASFGTSEAPGIPLCANGTDAPPVRLIAIRDAGPAFHPSHEDRLKTSSVPSGENARALSRTSLAFSSAVNGEASTT